MSNLSLFERYNAAVAQGLIQRDLQQLVVLEQLGSLAQALKQAQRPNFRTWFGLSKPCVKGVYLWGEVGRGKTFLMDLFFETLPIQAKQRWHFHRFMQWVHQQGLPQHRGKKDPLVCLAKQLGQQLQLLCFDEFVVNDIGDAMLLGGLIQALFQQGVTLVATSNVAPSNLYRDGLQRALFLPAIQALEVNTQVIHLYSDKDHRLQFLRSNILYFCPISPETEAQFSTLFHHLACGQPKEESMIQIEGRWIPTKQQAQAVIWFEFSDLCQGGRSVADYIALARDYHTILLSKVPQLNAETEDAARRFIHLIDECYDRKVKLILSSFVPIEQLYMGKQLSFEFKRTQSRLIEMQSAEYLSLAHIP